LSLGDRDQVVERRLALTPLALTSASQFFVGDAHQGAPNGFEDAHHRR
jgi:hypothetical protein